MLLNFTTEVVVITFNITGITLLVFMCLTPAVMGVASGKMARLLHDLSKITDVGPPPTYRWYCKPLTLVVMFSGISYMIYTMYMTAQRFINILVYIISLIVYCPNVLGNVLPQQVTSMVFGLLASHLMAATKAAVATISPLLALDGSFKCDKDEVAAMEALRHLDAAIREVCDESLVVSWQGES